MIRTERDLFGRLFGVPLEFVDVRTKIHKLKTNSLAFVVVVRVICSKSVPSFEVFRFGVIIFEGRSFEVLSLGRLSLRFYSFHVSGAHLMNNFACWETLGHFEELVIVFRNTLVLRAHSVWSEEAKAAIIIKTFLLLFLLVGLFCRLFAKHRFKDAQNVLLVVLAQHDWKLCNLFALFGAGYKRFSVDAEVDVWVNFLGKLVSFENLIYWFVVVRVGQFQRFIALVSIFERYSAELICADRLLTDLLMCRQIFQQKRFWANLAANLVLMEHFYHYCGRSSIPYILHFAHLTASVCFKLLCSSLKL